ncbi:hypothetical protein BH11VER1_BH11VER1_06350 [soil metagenome]
MPISGWLNFSVSNPPSSNDSQAYFIHPDWARRGIGKAILAGEPLYLACDYLEDGRYEVPLIGGLTLPVVLMKKTLSAVDLALDPNPEKISNGGSIGQSPPRQP